MADPPAVLHVVAPARFGGLERVVSALARGAQARARNVHVLAFLDRGTGEHPLVTELVQAGVPAQGVEVPPRRYDLERGALRRVVRMTGARVVHTHGCRVDVVDSPAARALGVATVSTLHGFTAGSWKNRFYEALEVRAVRKCDGVVAVSRPMASQLLNAGVPAGRLRMIPNAWSAGAPPLERAEARRLLGIPDNGFRVGWVGRFTSEKGADVLLEALALLVDLPLSVSFVGAGPRQRRFEQWAQQHGVASRITWHGNVEDAGQSMRAFDVFALSSRTEGTPIVLFEAMAAGVPIVATAVGGVPDVVTPVEGLLVPRDDPAALATAIRKVFEEPHAARNRTAAARMRLATHFAVDDWLDAYEHLYEHVARRDSIGRCR